MCAARQGDGDGVVGFFVVGFGVLVWWRVRAGHPAAGQAQPQFDPACPLLPARWAFGGERLDVAVGGTVRAAARAAAVGSAVEPSWHHGPRSSCRPRLWVWPCLLV